MKPIFFSSLEKKCTDESCTIRPGEFQFYVIFRYLQHSILNIKKNIQYHHISEKKTPQIEFKKTKWFEIVAILLKKIYFGETHHEV